MMLAVGTALVGTTPASAAPPEPIDAEFLDYLADYEGKQDNWTVVASEQERSKAPVQPVVTKPDPKAKTPPVNAASPAGVKP